MFAGIRRDEEATRAKERVFSPRGAEGLWDVRDSRPSSGITSTPRRRRARICGCIRSCTGPRERHLAIHAARGIPIIPLYLSHAREALSLARRRRHHLSDRLHASSLDEIIAELDTTRIPERSGRAMDHESEDAFERLRTAGYL